MVKGVVTCLVMGVVKGCAHMFGHGCSQRVWSHFGHGCGQRAWSRVWSHFCHGCGHRAWSKGVVIGRDQARGCDQGCGHMLGLSAWSLGVVKGCCQTLCIKGVASFVDH